MLEQEKIIAKVKDLAAVDERIVAVLMYGSFTQGAGDAFSDVEFYVFVKDEDLTVFDTRCWIESLEPVYVHFFNDYGTEVVIFRQLIRGEFHFLSQSEMHIIEGFAPVGYVPDIESMCLYDADGELRRYLAKLDVAAAAVKRDDAATIEYTINNCLNLLLMGVNVLKRGELARALDTLAQARIFYARLLRLNAGSTHHWLNPMKNLECEISSVAYERFAAATCGLRVLDLERAYAALADNLTAVIEELKQKYSFKINIQLIERIKDYIMQ